MNNDNACLSASKEQEIRTGNYHLIWSGFISGFLAGIVREREKSGFVEFLTGQTMARARGRGMAITCKYAPPTPSPKKPCLGQTYLISGFWSPPTLPYSRPRALCACTTELRRCYLLDVYIGCGYVKLHRCKLNYITVTFWKKKLHHKLNYVTVAFWKYCPLLRETISLSELRTCRLLAKK